ncbi:LLM class flavin-dependent oxidoreductase [Cumulibacter soli]|uniref:LLM class flavin-dependent oxidoreductase n=1 Tax=Cumulibacter soli TaxID=2546344 RepID=UPI001067B7A1|nr:LLM class flavin-dependent oxidoreductase [Cumulibacter soli]
MRFSLWLPANRPWSELRDLATHAEQSGWSGIWLADHFMPNTPEPNTDPTGEALAQLAALAAVVPRVRIGPLVLGNTYRHPAVVAKTAAAIDEISGGRFVLGIGAGWQVNEHEAFGLELGTVRERLSWFREACQIFQSLRDEELTTFDGERYQLRDASLNPKPVGPLPILIGASGEKVMPKIVAEYAEEWNTWSTPEVFAHKTAVMSAACEARGRDPKTLHRSTQALVFIGPDGAAKAEHVNKTRAAIGGTPEQLADILGQYAEAGLDEFILPTMSLGAADVEAINEFADQFLTEAAHSIAPV